MKNWPPVQKARITISMPDSSPIHQSSLISRAMNAWMIHNVPTMRNRKPRMSAIAANVFSGLMKETTPATRNSAPKIPLQPAVPVDERHDHDLLGRGADEHQPDDDARPS